MQNQFTAFVKKNSYIAIGLAVGGIAWWKLTPSHENNPVNLSQPTPPLGRPKFETNDDLQHILRQDVLTVMGYDEADHVDKKIAVTKSLPSDLSQLELETLLRSLLEKRPAHLRDGQHAFAFHELCNKLHRYKQIREKYAETLYQVALDNSYDAVVRDYAIQHLRRVWSAADLGLRASIEASFWKLAESQPAISASAILSLHTLGVKTSPKQDYQSASVSSDHFKPYLKKILSAPMSQDNIPQRMIAVRVIGDRGLLDMANELVSVIKNPHEHTLVRAAAINALGKSDRQQLQNLDPLIQQNPSLKLSYQHALR